MTTVSLNPEGKRMMDLNIYPYFYVSSKWFMWLLALSGVVAMTTSVIDDVGRWLNMRMPLT